MERIAGSSSRRGVRTPSRTAESHRCQRLRRNPLLHKAPFANRAACQRASRWRHTPERGSARGTFGTAAAASLAGHGGVSDSEQSQGSWLLRTVPFLMFAIRDEAITNSTDGLDQVAKGAKLFPQRFDVNVDCPRQ